MTEQQASPRNLGGIDNFRDFGGGRVRGGGHVRRGLLFRSGHLHRAAPADGASLAALGITHVFDLRSKSERGEQPSAVFPDFLATTIDGRHARDERVAAPDASLDGAQFMSGQYRSFPFEAAHLAVFTRYFETLANEPGAVLIHCAAGKDRTGLLAALTLRLLDVEPADIERDYLATNIGHDIEARVPVLRAYLERTSAEPVSEDMVRSMLRADAAWLAVAFDAIIARCGSVDAYLAEMLGVDQGRAQAIRARLLVREA